MVEKNKKTNKKEELKPIVTHTMADGSVRDSVEGYFCTVNKYTKNFYMLLAECVKEQA